MAYRKIPPEEKAKRLVDSFLKTYKGDLDKAKQLFYLSQLGGTRTPDESRLIEAEFMRREGYTERQIRGLIYGDWGKRKVKK